MAVVLPIAAITAAVLGEILSSLGSVQRKTAITIKNHSTQILDQHDLHFVSGTSDWGLPGPVPNGEGLVWGARKTAGPIARGAVGVFVYHIKDKNQSLAFMWSIPFDYNFYYNWWGIQAYDGLIDANYDLFYQMYYNGSPHKGDSLTYKGDLNFGWRYEGSMGASGTPYTVINIYKD